MTDEALFSYDGKMKWNIWEAEQQTAREADALNLLHVIRPNILSDYYNMYIKVSIDPCNQSKTLGPLNTKRHDKKSSYKCHITILYIILVLH